jgi:hypothetical protein
MMSEDKRSVAKWQRADKPLQSELDQQRSLIEATGLTMDDFALAYLDSLRALQAIVNDKKASTKDRIAAAKRLMDLPKDMPGGHGNTKGQVTNQTIIVQGSMFDED